jgi:hypothetical protein
MPGQDAYSMPSDFLRGDQLQVLKVASEISAIDSCRTVCLRGGAAVALVGPFGILLAHASGVSSARKSRASNPGRNLHVKVLLEVLRVFGVEQYLPLQTGTESCAFPRETASIMNRS